MTAKSDYYYQEHLKYMDKWDDVFEEYSEIISGNWRPKVAIVWGVLILLVIFGMPIMVALKAINPVSALVIFCSTYGSFYLCEKYVYLPWKVEKDVLRASLDSCRNISEHYWKRYTETR